MCLVGFWSRLRSLLRAYARSLVLHSSNLYACFPRLCIGCMFSRAFHELQVVLLGVMIHSLCSLLYLLLCFGFYNTQVLGNRSNETNVYILTAFLNNFLTMKLSFVFVLIETQDCPALPGRRQGSLSLDLKFQFFFQRCFFKTIFLECWKHVDCPYFVSVSFSIGFPGLTFESDCLSQSYQTVRFKYFPLCH